jgi:allantoinase
MHSPDFVIRGMNIVTPNEIGPAAVHVRAGRIEAVNGFDEVPHGCRVVEAGESVVMPGLVDSHVHVNEPGRTEWEGFETATRAAAAGGVTTIVDMPLNSIPPTTTRKGFEEKLNRARGKCAVDVAFWGGVVPGNATELASLLDAGVVGFKCFLVPSGVDEFQHVTEADLRPALEELRRIDAVLIAHAEVPGPIEHAHAQHTQAVWGDPRSYSTFLSSRPRAAENEAIALLIKLCKETDARIHVVHHSSADALGALRDARNAGLPITVETCPHYLAFVAEEIPEGATEFKCCPPIRERENCEQLWSALREGLIDMVVSDHSPCPPAMKLGAEGDFLKAWGGISSLQLRLPVMWTLASKRGFGLREIVEWLCTAPARLAGLNQRKGSIAVGKDADLVVWNPSATFTVEPSTIHHRHKLTPYNGEILTGVVEATYLRGEKIYDGIEISSSILGEQLLNALRDETK